MVTQKSANPPIALQFSYFFMFSNETEVCKFFKSRLLVELISSATLDGLAICKNQMRENISWYLKSLMIKKNE